MKQITRLSLLIILMIVTFSILIAITVFAGGRSIQGRMYSKKAPLQLGVINEITIPKRIYNMSIAQGLTEYEANRMVKIAFCESKFDPNAKNKTSTASGLFQFLNSTWKAYGSGDVFDPVDNINSAIHLFKKKGFNSWSCNKII